MTSKGQKTRRGLHAKARKRKTPLNTATREWRQLQIEAQQLGLTTREYVRLILHVSSTLRAGLAQDREIDGKQLLKWVENPVFVAMIQWVSQYAVAAMNGESTSEDSKKGTTVEDDEHKSVNSGSTQQSQTGRPLYQDSNSPTMRPPGQPMQPQYPMQQPGQQPIQPQVPMQQPGQRPIQPQVPVQQPGQQPIQPQVPRQLSMPRGERQSNSPPPKF
ncbi:hypothetical protein [Alicyclobacillus sp. SO9]|uniref:hypothetical protein n=1 Tax=Alicyclobacillus sp. SO9 TaxID=2665646 RepID=UPI0018E885C7|nr:hypothetical protein [Alicyclobacillus sp. SO9]QQE80694.1 hypothetical protein GI364_10040 [Alicyclobacillus sp. SO9]